MKLQKAAARYSKALFELEGSKEQRLENLEGLLELWNKNPLILTFLSSPSIGKEDKVDLLKKAVGDGKDEKLSSFFSLLINANRSNIIPVIIKDYRKQVIESLGVIEATLSTAVPLESQEKEKLQLKLENHYNKRVQIKEKIDPAIIGGAILSIGNSVIDYSIRGRLETLRKELCK